MTQQQGTAKILSVLTQWSLVSLFLFPVLPEWRINAVFITFCSLSLLSSFFNKPVNFKHILLKNVIITIPFIPYLVEYVTHHSDFIAGFELEKKLLFFIAPLVFSLYSATNKWQPLRTYLNAFTLALVVLVLYSIARLLFDDMLFSAEALDNGARLLRFDFANIAKLHPTYYGLYATVAILWLVYDYQNQVKKWKILYVFSGCALLFLELMLAPKMPLIALGVLLIYMLYKINRNKKALLLKYVLLAIFFVVVPFIVPSVKNRLMDTKSIFKSTSLKMDERLIIFNCGKDIFTDNLWLGIGSRNDQRTLDSCYAEKKFADAKNIIYNAHNQFFTLGINYGIVIVLLFVFMLIYFIVRTKHNLFARFFMIAIIMVMLTESVLERQWGVYFFVLFFMLLYNAPVVETNE